MFSLQIKLVNISSNDIVDGNTKITLGLVWNIILHWQVSGKSAWFICNATFSQYPHVIVRFISFGTVYTEQPDRSCCHGTLLALYWVVDISASDLILVLPVSGTFHRLATFSEVVVTCFVFVKFQGGIKHSLSDWLTDWWTHGLTHSLTHSDYRNKPII